MNHQVVFEINETLRFESYSKLDHISLCYSDELVYRSVDIPLNELDKTLRVFEFLKRFLKEADKIND